jgi:membrane protein implicated in regulation of membrane protease activity
MDNSFVVWVLAGIVLLGLEMWKTGLFNASLGFGALLASGVSVIFPNQPSWEIWTFLGVSFFLFHFVRPLVKKSLDQENFLPGPETLHGVHGVLLDKVVGNKLGTLEVYGDVWSCMGEEGYLGNKGDKAVVIGHSGTVLTVRIMVNQKH